MTYSLAASAASIPTHREAVISVLHAQCVLMGVSSAWVHGLAAVVAPGYRHGYRIGSTRAVRTAIDAYGVEPDAPISGLAAAARITREIEAAIEEARTATV